MKTLSKKILSSTLAALTVFNATALAVTAANPTPGEDLEFYYIESGEPGEYGYISEKLVDENGNEVIFEEPEELPINCFSLNGASPIPTSFDAREEGIFTPVKNQGSTNNCWIFSTISALEADSIANGLTEKDGTDFSEAHLAWFACRPVTDDENDISGKDGTNYASPYYQGGNWRMATAALARRSGLANEADFPFGSISSMGNYSENDRYNTDSGVIIDSAQELTDTEEIKEWIRTHGSVSAAFYYSDTYYNPSESSYCCNIAGKTNHQITVIGWDDSYPAANFSDKCTPANNGAWICRNSWGTSWGDDGYFFLSYYDASLSDFVGFTVRSSEEVYNNYCYDGAGWNVAVSSGLSELASANVYVSQGYEKITSVSTYTAMPNVHLRVEIYKNLPENYSVPSEGTLAASFGESIDNSGYHTLEINDEITLEPGEIFSVAVYQYNCNGAVKVPFEKTNGSTAYHSGEKESYILMNTSTNYWGSSSKYGLQSAPIHIATECSHSVKESVVTAEPACNIDGTLSEVCTQCGDISSTKVITRSEHVYGEWSSYSHNSDTNTEESFRECINCGTVQTKSYNSGNTVRLEEFLLMLFTKFFDIFRFIK